MSEATTRITTEDSQTVGKDRTPVTITTALTTVTHSAVQDRMSKTWPGWSRRPDNVTSHRSTVNRETSAGHVTMPVTHTARHPITFGKERMSQLIAGTVWVLKVTNQCTDRLQDTSNAITISSPLFTHDFPW